MPLGSFFNPPPDPAGQPDPPDWLEQAAKFVAATRFQQLFGADGGVGDHASTGPKEDTAPPGHRMRRSPYVGAADELPTLGHPDWN